MGDSTEADPDCANPIEVVEDMFQEAEFVVKKEESEDEFESYVGALMSNNEEVIFKEEPDDISLSEFIPMDVKEEAHDPLEPEVQESQSVLTRSRGKDKKSSKKKSKKSKTKKVSEKNATGKSLNRFVCHHCKYACRSKGNLKVHIQSHTGEKPYACDQCDYRAGIRTHLANHKRIHTGEKPYACDQCDYRAGIRTHLANHKRIHTGERPFECKFCGYRAYQLGNLLEHERVHSDIRPFKCDYCDYRAKRRRHLTGHLLIHQRDNPKGQKLLYKCEFCGFKSSGSQNLKYHVRRHTGERPYKCDYCHYEAAQKGSLNTHMKRHTGVKIYNCDHCDFRCAQELSMRTHLYKHTGNTPFSCYNCGFSTSYKPTLAKHIQGCHEKPNRMKSDNPDPIETVCQEQLPRTAKRLKCTRMSRFEPSLLFECTVCKFTTTYKPALGRHMLMHNNCESRPKKARRIKVKPIKEEFKVVLEDPPQPVERFLRKRTGLKPPGRFLDYLLPGSVGDDPTTESRDAASSGDEFWLEEL